MGALLLNFILRYLHRVPIDGNVSGKGEICSNCRSEVNEGWTSCQDCQAKRIMHLTPLGDRINSVPEKIEHWTGLLFISGLFCGPIAMISYVAANYDANSPVFYFFIGCAIVFTTIRGLTAVFSPVLKIIALALILDKKAFTVEYKKD